MKANRTFPRLILVALVLSLVTVRLSTGFAQGTAFTYQGRLQQGGHPATGLYEMYFTLHDALTNGNVVGSPQTIAPLPVSNGLFTTALDFGAAAFMGADRWLEISVTVFGSDQPVVPLVPRQLLTPAPYALHAQNAGGLMSFNNAPMEIKVNGQRALRLEPTELTAGIPGTPNVIGGSPQNTTGAGVMGATVAGGGAIDSSGVPSPNTVGASYGTVSGGGGNRIGSGATFATISGGSDNYILLDAGNSVVGGGSRNAVGENSSYATIAGGEGNRIAREAWNTTIGGGEVNLIMTQADAATIGGGAYNAIGAAADNTMIGGGILNTNDARSAILGGGEQNWLEVDAEHGTLVGGFGNRSAGHGAFLGGGAANRIALDAVYSTITGGIGNLIDTNASRAAIGGGVGNIIQGNDHPFIASYSVIAGGMGNLIEGKNGGTTISGGLANKIETNALYATISGGQENVVGPTASASSIAGGLHNTIEMDAAYAAIGGGRDNVVRKTAFNSVIGGGEGNIVEELATWSMIGGGLNNQVFTSYGVVGGGFGNRIEQFSLGGTIAGGQANLIQANVSFGTIPGGLFNSVEGNHGLAAGLRAKARHAGAFVWADASDRDFSSTTTNEFSVRATGGARFVTAINANGSNIAGVTLAAGSGSWSSLSDRNAKENFTAANARAILDRVAALPLASWNYKAQGAGVRHLGPTAQDFHAAFGLGESDRAIATVDADGVALAAIQGLNRKLEETLDQKEREIMKLKKRNDSLEQRLQALERIVLNPPSK